MAHVPFDGNPSLNEEWAGRRMSLLAGMMSIFPAAVQDSESMKTVKELMESQFIGDNLCLNTTRFQWEVHKREDEYLGPIYECMSATSGQDPASFLEAVSVSSEDTVL